MTAVGIAKARECSLVRQTETNDLSFEAAMLRI